MGRKQAGVGVPGMAQSVHRTDGGEWLSADVLLTIEGPTL